MRRKEMITKDSVLMFGQVLPAGTVGNVWRAVRRIHMMILVNNQSL